MLVTEDDIASEEVTIVAEEDCVTVEGGVAQTKESTKDDEAAVVEGNTEEDGVTDRECTVDRDSTFVEDGIAEEDT